MDFLGIGKMVVGTINGFGERRARKNELEVALHTKQLEGVQAIDQGVIAAQLGQLQVNAQEAKHKSLFVAGWRPFVGWICGFGLAYNIIISPILGVWIPACTPESIDPCLPPVDPSLLYPVLLGMLGLGAMRTKEKMDGVTHH